MTETKDSFDEGEETPATGLRMIRIIILETLAVAVIGFLVLGVAAEAGWYRAGFIAAIVIWVGVSPVIEIATVIRMREISQNRRSTSRPPEETHP
jgi:hypothetical protein